MRRIAFVLMLGFACFLSAAEARADDPFTVSGISVDASGASASVAQNQAINSGRARAWSTLYRRLTKSQDWARQPAIDDLTLQRMIRSYMPSNERRSTTRYVANMTYVFNPDAVRRVLRAQNIAYVDMETKPILVIAMSPGYAPHSPWAAQWTNPKFASGTVPILPPVGDAIDQQSLGALNFATAQWQDVEPAASRVHATEAFFVQASSGKAGLTVALRRLSPGAATPIPNVVVPLRPGEQPAQAYGAAVDAAAASIIEVWKSHAAVDFNKRFKLTAEVHIDSLSDWGALTQKLSSLPVVTEVNVVAMNTGEARLAITYVGTSEQLVALASQSDLELSNSGGAWQLAFQEPVPSPTPAPR